MAELFRLLIKPHADTGLSLLKIIPGFGHSNNTVEILIAEWEVEVLKKTFKAIKHKSGIIELQYEINNNEAKRILPSS